MTKAPRKLRLSTRYGWDAIYVRIIDHPLSEEVAYRLAKQKREGERSRIKVKKFQDGYYLYKHNEDIRMGD